MDGVCKRRPGAVEELPHLQKMYPEQRGYGFPVPSGVAFDRLPGYAE